MKSFIVLSAIFCLSAISAVPTQEPSQLAKAAAEHYRQVAVEYEQAISGWDSKASLGSNLFSFLSAPFEAKALTYNPDISAKENVESYFAILLSALKQYLAPDAQTPADLLGALAIKFVTDKKLPLPLFPQSEIEIETNKRFAKFFAGQALVTKKGFNAALQTWLDSLADVKFADSNAFLKANLEKVVSLITVPGFSADKTLEDIVVLLIEYIYEKTEL